MPKRRKPPLAKAFYLILLCIPSWTWAADASTNAAQPGLQSLDFGVFWPPRDPTRTPPSAARALLDGRLVLHLENLPNAGWVMRLKLALNRPADEAAREFWNSKLAFPQYDWMRYVRVWDAGQRWQWPNLPYLLRLHGKERVDRYGGVDPGKDVDDDFAAVLIRKYEGSGQSESEETKKAPLVSAEWYPEGVGVVDKQTIVHTARSDEFTLHLAQTGKQHQGSAKVWFIYADFMGAKPPETWPMASEFNGGILAFFEIEWAVKAHGKPEVTIRQTAPKQSTDFNWEGWTTRTLASPDSKNTAKLSDHP